MKKIKKERVSVNYYYNKEGIGDTLLIDFLKETESDINYERQGDVVVVKNNKGEVLGGHLFNASEYLSIEGNGKVKVSDDAVATLNRLFTEKGFDLALTVNNQADFIVGYVKEKAAHPDADKLSVCQVDVGDKLLQIVCGAPNVDAGQKVVVAQIGALMPSGLVIKESELRGVRSEGMICSARELGLPNAPTKKGILVLEDTYKVGEAFNG
jgi:tRNA-binding protein